MSNTGLLPDRGKAVTIFSGVGASSYALREEGYSVIAHDVMPEAVETLRANLFAAREIDVRDVDWRHPVYADTRVLIGGPPCQPFSQAADNAGEYDERDMIPEYIRAVRELKPEFFVMEEVQTLTWKRHAAYLERVVDDLRGEGYVVEYKVLDSSKHGSGQARKRLFIVGRRIQVTKIVDGQYEAHAPEIHWPTESPEWARQTMAEALGWDAETCRQRNQMAPEPARIDPNHFDDQRHLWPQHRASTTVVGTFRPEVQAAPGYRRAGDGPRQNTPGSVVTTLEERLILQGLPADWHVAGTEAKRALQVGNSCPTQVLTQILQANPID